MVSALISLLVLCQVQPTDLRRGLHLNGNIRTTFFSDGGMGGPARMNPWPRMEWPAGSGHQYLYEMDLLIAAKVKGYNSATAESTWLWILDDAVKDGGDGDLKPVAGYANEAFPDTLALSRIPSSWPDEWAPYHTLWGDTIVGLSGKWPGEFGPGVVLGDEEGFFVAADFWNFEFSPDSSVIYYDPQTGYGGLGLWVEVHTYVFNSPELADGMIYSFLIHNLSPKPLDSLAVGWYVDASIGGPGFNSSDDLIGYDPVLQYVYFSDQDGWGYDAGGNAYRCGQMGIFMLQTPGNPSDGVDNDADGMVDESPWNGIDDDGDWNPATDDVGRDGLPNTGDPGEGNGVPDPGEPRFEWRDPDEIDQIGMTSVYTELFGFMPAWLDSVVAPILVHRVSNSPPPPGDYVAFIGSGPFSLPPGQWTKFAFAIVMADSNVPWPLVEKGLRIRHIYETSLGLGLTGVLEDQTPAATQQPPVVVFQDFSSGVLRFQIKREIPGLWIRVFDPAGRVRGRRAFSRLSAGQVVQVPYREMLGPGFAPGVYFVHLRTTDGFSYTKKIWLVGTR